MCPRAGDLRFSCKACSLVPAPRSRRDHPEWEFDELVLSLDPYLSQEHLDADPPRDAADPHVLAFSELLQTLGLNGSGDGRSPRAVVGMLERWKAVDGEWNFARSARGARRETAVWSRFLTSHMGDDGLSADDTEFPNHAERGVSLAPSRRPRRSAPGGRRGKAEASSPCPRRRRSRRGENRV